MTLGSRLRRLFAPHFTAHLNGRPQFFRWHLTPRNRWFSIYLHNFVQSDSRVPHDHPWDNATLIIRGRYWENNAAGRWPIGAFQLVRRKAHAPHWVELCTDSNGRTLPSWSLFFCGRRKRVWGFHCPNGWVHHQQYLRLLPGGNEAGRGCD